MARVTIEDCLKKVDNRFDLVLMATKRAKNLSAGVKPLIGNQNNEKTTVIALREIEDGAVDVKDLLEEVLEDIRLGKLVDQPKEDKPRSRRSQDSAFKSDSVSDSVF